MNSQYLLMQEIRIWLYINVKKNVYAFNFFSKCKTHLRTEYIKGE